MIIIGTIIPTSSHFLSFLTNQKQESGFQQVGGLVRGNIFVICL